VSRNTAHLPDADVHVVAARVHVAGIAGEAHGEHALHALGVVHLPAVAAVVGEDSQRAVVGARGKLAPRRREVHVHDRRHKVLRQEGEAFSAGS